jgi:hypothetical protein
MVFFSPTYFGEISIFGLSKDPATRIWSTLMNPEQFLILVTYLFRLKKLNYRFSGSIDGWKFAFNFFLLNYE